MFNQRFYIVLAGIIILSLVLIGCVCSGPKTGNATGTPQAINTGTPKVNNTVTSNTGISNQETTDEGSQIATNDSQAGKTITPVAVKINSAAVTPAAPRGVTGTVTTAAPVSAVSANIAAAGGALTVSTPGSPIKGLTVTVPANAYSAAKQFSISYAPIQSHTFGDLFKPATPLISINNGGEMSKTYMQVKIPITVPDGSLAMAFLYDDQTKTLEGLPTLAHDANSVTVGTRHFSNIILSLINRSLLKPDIDSDFRPGIDDWQFTNFGSYIASGHCTGQSMTAMWYYIEQPDGKGLTLNGRYDNNGDQPATPNLWQDDSQGYRFCSVVWKDMDWDALGRSLTEDYIASDDQDTFDLFRYSMQLTKQPQMTEIWNTTVGGGHALVVYRIKDGNLYVADPNWPGKEDRSIVITNGKFKPYESGENYAEILAGHSKKYDKITYVAKTSLSDWKSIATHWAELKAGTVGNAYFPGYTIEDRNAAGTMTAQGYMLPQPFISFKITPNSGHLGFQVYRDGSPLTPDKTGANWKYPLNPGLNKIGIYIDGKVGDDWKYVNFEHINVIYSSLIIDPATLDGEINKEYTFTAAAGNPPANIRYSWSVDGVSIQTDTQKTFKTIFKSAGKHTVGLKLLDAAGKELQKAESTANIKDAPSASGPVNNLAILQKYGYLEASVLTNSQVHEYNKYNKPTDVDKQANVNFWTIYTPLTWDGVKFSGTKTDNLMGSTAVEALSGTVSPDGNTILSLTSHLQIDSTIEHHTVNMVLQNIPLTYINGVLQFVDITSGNVQKNVVSLENNLTDVDSKGETYNSVTFKSPTWDNNSHLDVQFRKTATR